jgi:phospholipase/lecithinase/hemolysin
MRKALLKLLLIFSTVAHGQPYSRVIVFGDSYSDSERSYAISKRTLESQMPGAVVAPALPFWNGRWSNGPTAVEMLAERLEIPLENHAVGGALSGHGNANTLMNAFGNTGMLAQVMDYVEQARRADPKALYVLFASANDFFALSTMPSREELQALADRAVSNQIEALDRLLERGANHVLVVGSTDLEMVPMVINAGHARQAAAFRDRINSELQHRLAKSERYRAHVVFFNHAAFSTPVREDPQRLGFAEMSTACLRPGIEGQDPCGAPDSYYFWDDVHPTAHVHRLVAEAMHEALRQKQR